MNVFRQMYLKIDLTIELTAYRSFAYYHEKSSLSELKDFSKRNIN